MTGIKTSMKEIKEREHKMGNIHRLIELNAGHWEQKRKSPNTKLDIWHTNTAPKPGKMAHTM